MVVDNYAMHKLTDTLYLACLIQYVLRDITTTQQTAETQKLWKKARNCRVAHDATDVRFLLPFPPKTN